MHVTYQPEDGDKQEWDFDPGRVRSSVAEVMERRYGDTWDTFSVGIQQGDTRARRVLLWHLLCQQHASMRFEDTPDFYASELLVEFSVKELAQMRDKVLAAKLPEKDRDKALIVMDMEMERAVAREGAKPELAGKAPSEISATDGG